MLKRLNSKILNMEENVNIRIENTNINTIIVDSIAHLNHSFKRKADI